METLTRGSTCRHDRIHVTTRHPTEFIDLTDQLERLVADAGLRFGLLNVQTLHTTTAVIVNESLRKQAWGDQDAVGKRITFAGSNDQWATVVGVVGDIRHFGDRLETHPQMKPVTIGHRRIGPGEPTFVVAEIGINHNGSVQIAKELIEAAILIGKTGGFLSGSGEVGAAQAAQKTRKETLLEQTDGLGPVLHADHGQLVEIAAGESGGKDEGSGERPGALVDRAAVGGVFGAQKSLPETVYDPPAVESARTSRTPTRFRVSPWMPEMSEPADGG